MTFYSPTRISRLGPAPDYVQGNTSYCIYEYLSTDSQRSFPPSERRHVLTAFMRLVQTRGLFCTLNKICVIVTNSVKENMI
jgi:hypothetical protein